MTTGDWIAYRIEPATDLSGAGIYLWRVGDECYVGKATRLRSRLREYLNNVRKLEECRPYRKGKPCGFRPIHVELFKAKLAGVPIEWTVLEQCEAAHALLERERYWIATLRPTLNGPARPRINT